MAAVTAPPPRLPARSPHLQSCRPAGRLLGGGKDGSPPPRPVEGHAAGAGAFSFSSRESRGRRLKSGGSTPHGGIAGSAAAASQPASQSTISSLPHDPSGALGLPPPSPHPTNPSHKTPDMSCVKRQARLGGIKRASFAFWRVPHVGRSGRTIPTAPPTDWVHPLQHARHRCERMEVPSPSPLSLWLLTAGEPLQSRRPGWRWQKWLWGWQRGRWPSSPMPPPSSPPVPAGTTVVANAVMAAPLRTRPTLRP